MIILFIKKYDSSVDLNELRIFARVAEWASSIHAAEQLGLTKSGSVAFVIIKRGFGRDECQSLTLD